MTREDFVIWKTSNVTKTVFGLIEEKIEDAKEVLIRQAGIDSTEDAVLRGYIRALYDVLNVDLQEVDE